VYEPKWDGHRAVVRIRAGGQIDAISSSGTSRTAAWPWLASLADTLRSRRGEWIIDGEVIALDDEARHSFQLVGRPDRPHAFVAFDVLVADGADLTGRSWQDRRARLEAALSPTAAIMLTPVSDDADVMLEVTRAAGFEGIIAKRRSSPYQPGRRSPSWVKVKHRREQEVVVGGYLAGQGNRSGTFGSLLVGVYEGDALRFAGAIGTGFDDRTLTELRARLAQLRTESCPFDPEPKLPRGAATWVRPELVAQAAFAEWTEGGHLRHPVYLGLRDDKQPADVVREP
jgi:bifunctional non-homologous end joining protein LigD